MVREDPGRELRRVGRNQRLHFDRVKYSAKVWLNGNLMGENWNGYLPFSFDVTGLLEPDSSNLLVLRVGPERPRVMERFLGHLELYAPPRKPIRKPRGAPARSPPKRGSGPAARPRSPAGLRTTTDPVIPGEICSADPPPRTSKAQPGQAPEHRIPPAPRPHLPIDFALCEVPRPRGRAFAEVHDRATSPTAALFWISRDSAQLSRAS
ncbi:MAG: glycosyl hydrolase 2 galactose-binding domain-containing protein [Planctomycetota bacterium]